MSDVEKIKDSLDVVSVVGEYIKLEKAGVNFRACCPFHKEKTPSFFVSPSRNSYYCFGCGTNGDIFSFVQEFEGLDFKEALRLLADRAGITLSRNKAGKQAPEKKLYTILEDATKFFEEELVSNKEAKKYLKDRGLKEGTASSFRIGYAPVGWRNCHTHLLQKGYTEKDLLRAGLIKTADSEDKNKTSTYDRFRSRIMFPIGNMSGKIVGFSGRIFPEDSGIAKYLNSPETEVFDKSKILFGLDKAKGAIRKFDFTILVEGQFDLLMSHQIGFPNTVALSGTALSDEHLSYLARFSKNIVLLFDADKAGFSAVAKNGTRALASGMEVKVGKLPSGIDPADLANKGKDAFRKVIRESVHIIDFFLAISMEEEKDARKRYKQIRETVLPFIVRMDKAFDRSHFVNRIAQALGISEDTVIDELKTVVVSEEEYKGTSKVGIKEDLKKQSRREIIENQLLGTLLSKEVEQKNKKNEDYKDLRKKIEEILGKPHVEDRLLSLKKGSDHKLFALEREGEAHSDESKRADETETLLYELRMLYLRQVYANALQDLRDAEVSGDEKKIEKLLKLCKEYSEKIQLHSKN